MNHGLGPFFDDNMSVVHIDSFILLVYYVNTPD